MCFDHIFTHIVTYWQLRNALQGACSDNSNSLLSDGLEYVSAKCGPLDLVVPAWQPKANVQGFNYPMLTQPLCPIDFLESFDEDPERCGISHVCLHADNFYRFHNKLVNGSIKVHSMDFLLCLYNKALIDKEDPSAGLMRSKLLDVVHFSIFVINYNINFSSSFSNTFSLGCQLLWRMGWVAAKKRGSGPKKQHEETYGRFNHLCCNPGRFSVSVGYLTNDFSCSSNGVSVPQMTGILEMEIGALRSFTVLWCEHLGSISASRTMVRVTTMKAKMMMKMMMRRWESG